MRPKVNIGYHFAASFVDLDKSGALLMASKPCCCDDVDDKRDASKDTSSESTELPAM